MTTTDKQIPLALAMLFLAAAALHSPQPQAYPVGDEFMINSNVDDPGTISDNDQQLPDTAMDADGNFVVVFQNDVPGSGATVAARLYDAQGTPAAAEFQVNTTGINDTMFPNVAMDEAGDFVVVWMDNFADGNSDGIMAQRYNAAGIPQGNNVTVNTTTEGRQYRADVAMDADGDFVVVWEDDPFNDTKRRIHGQRFSADGAPQGTELEISMDSAIDHTWPRVAMDADGDFVVSWQSGNVGANMDLAVRRFDVGGNPKGAPVLINGTTRVANASGIHSQTSVAMDAAGNFVVVWRADNFSGPGIVGAAIGILGQRFDTDGDPVGSVFEVDTDHAPQLNKPEAAMNADGDFIVAYEAQDPSLMGIRVQRYYSNGAPKGASFQVNTFTTLTQARPVAAIDASANAVIGWQSSQQDGAGEGVFAQQLSGRGVQPAMDFNNDFHADIAWRRTTTGGNAIWQMNGFVAQAKQSIPAVDATLWQIVGAGDFNRDGNADLLWRHAGTGQNVVWLMDGFTVVQADTIGAVQDLNWRVVGVGDFNMDSKSDILWRHEATGNIVIWLMDGLTRTSAASVGVPGPTWRVSGVDDFNADGKSDILFRRNTGQNALWLMDGLVRSDARPIPSVADTNWEIVGTGDFDRDDKADILWRNEVTGGVVIWLMDGFTFRNGQLILGVPDTNWKIEGVRDFDRDVAADILWRHAVSGSNVIWFMDGLTFIAGHSIGGVADSNWKIVP